MHSQTPLHVLIGAQQTAESSQSSQLLDAVARRAAERRCLFHAACAVTPTRPSPLVDQEDRGRAEAEARLATALPALSRAAGHEVVGVVARMTRSPQSRTPSTCSASIRVIISMLPARVSRSLHLDLARKVRGLSVPVIEVIDKEHHLIDVPAA